MYLHLEAMFVPNGQGPTVECYELEGLFWCKAKCNFSFKKISSQSKFFLKYCGEKRNDVFEAFITLIKRHPSFGNYTNATESANYCFNLS